MSAWTIFAICFTTVLLGAGSAFTLLSFYRAGRRMNEAESRGGVTRPRARARGRGV